MNKIEKMGEEQNSLNGEITEEQRRRLALYEHLKSYGDIPLTQIAADRNISYAYLIKILRGKYPMTDNMKSRYEKVFNTTL